MKKIFLFTALSALAMTGCNDDDKLGTPVNTNNYLIGNWSETVPTANAHKISFKTATAAIFTDTDGTKDTLDYVVKDNKLLFYPKGKTTGGSTHDLQKVSDSTIKLSNIYVSSGTGTPVIATFVKQ